MLKCDLLYQYLAAIVVGLYKLSDGMLIGWVSPNLLLLKSNDTPLSTGVLTEVEASWIPTIMPIGSIIGTLLYGFIVKSFGRKYPLIALAFPAIIGWFLVWFAENVYYLYFARLFHGIAIGASYVVAPVYLIEISDDRVRGILGSSIMITENVGVLMAFAIGGFCDYRILPIVAIVLNLLFIFFFAWFPETPTYHMIRNKEQKAEKSIRFYRNVQDYDNTVVEAAMDELKRTIKPRHVTNDGDDDGNDRLKCSDITTRPGSKALLIATVLVLINQFSGVFTLMNYAGEIFESAGTGLDPNLSSVVVQGIQAFGTCFVTSLTERAGRRFLYITSTIGCALGYIVLGTYMLLGHLEFAVGSYNWIPIVSFSFILFISSWAVSSLTFPVAAEIMPQKIREFGITFCAILLGLTSFIVLRSYPILRELINDHGCMFIFGGVCTAGAAFIIMSLPEIKGKTYEDIMNRLR